MGIECPPNIKDVAHNLEFKAARGEKNDAPHGFSAAAEHAAESFAKERWHAPKNPFKGGRR